MSNCGHNKVYPIDEPWLENYYRKRYPFNEKCICHSIAVNPNNMPLMFGKILQEAPVRLLLCNKACKEHPVCDGPCKSCVPYKIEDYCKLQMIEDIK